MSEQLNPELQEALQEAGADAKSSRAAAKSVAGAVDMAKCLIWLKAVIMVGGVLVALNIAILGRLFSVSDRVSENTAAIAAHSARLDETNRRVGNLEEGQREILTILRSVRFSESTFGESNGDAPEVSAAPVIAVPVPSSSPDPSNQ